jgi:hypothetical protein
LLGLEFGFALGIGAWMADGLGSFVRNSLLGLEFGFALANWRVDAAWFGFVRAETACWGWSLASLS